MACYRLRDADGKEVKALDLLAALANHTPALLAVARAAEEVEAASHDEQDFEGLRFERALTALSSKLAALRAAAKERL